MQNPKRLLFIILILFAVWHLIGFAGAIIATKKQPKNFENISHLEDQTVESVSFPSTDHINISAWFIPSKVNKDTAIIILSGIKSNRLSTLNHARFYIKKGYNVLLPDLRATGKSGGKYITLGWQERHDLLSACDFLKQKGISNIAAHGMSLGAATIIYSFQEKTDYAFVVLESAYDNIYNAFYNRLPILGLDAWIFQPLRFWTEYLVDAETKQLCPDQFIHLYQGKILMIAGDSEQQVKVNDTKRLYQNCSSPDKQLHWVKGGRHVNFLLHYSGEIEGVLDDFLK